MEPIRRPKTTTLRLIVATAAFSTAVALVNAVFRRMMPPTPATAWLFVVGEPALLATGLIALVGFRWTMLLCLLLPVVITAVSIVLGIVAYGWY